MKTNYNKSKIIATIGPSSMAEETLEKMIRAGVDVCRINASHGNHEMQQQVVDTVRKLNTEKKFKVAILYDLQGPKMRIGEVKNNEIMLVENESLILTVNDCIGDHQRIQIRYPYFHNDVHVGDTVLIDDGKIELQVTAKAEKDEVTAKVIHGGVLSSKKGINLPYTKISLPSLTDKDRMDLDFALQNNIEWIGLSFVRNANDIVELKRIISEKGKNARVIAKIEKPEAIRDIDNIIQESDGIMVARGDLGVEANVPNEQRRVAGSGAYPQESFRYDAQNRRLPLPARTDPAPPQRQHAARVAVSSLLQPERLREVPGARRLHQRKVSQTPARRRP